MRKFPVLSSKVEAVGGTAREGPLQVSCFPNFLKHELTSWGSSFSNEFLPVLHFQLCPNSEYSPAQIGKVDSQSLSLLLREHPQAEVTILEGLEGGWHHQILSWGELDPAGHLSKVHVGAGAGRGLVAQEEVPAQVCIRVALQLHKAMGGVSSSSDRVQSHPVELGIICCN